MLMLTRGCRLFARTGARLSSSGVGSSKRPEVSAGSGSTEPRTTPSSGNYLWGITDEQISSLSEEVRRAVSLENASSCERMKVDLHRAIEQWQERPGDTGSAAVQIATGSVRIDYLSRHLALHNKDKHSKRAMGMLIGQRNRMLKYLMQEDRDKYRKVCTELKVGLWKQLARADAQRSESA